MDNESWHLWATASMSSMGTLKYTAHLLPLLHLLRFIINACNKCVTLIRVVIDMEWQSYVVFNSSAAPLFIFLFFRRDKNITVCHFVSLVQRIFCELMSCLLCATCTVRISSSCQYLSIPVHVLPFILPFSLFFSFHFLLRSFLFRGISIALQPPFPLSLPRSLLIFW